MSTHPVLASPFVKSPNIPPVIQAQTLDNRDNSFEQQVLNVIRRNPKVLIEAVNNYNSQKQLAKLYEQGEILRRLYPNVNDLAGDSPRRGIGKIVLVEFADFQCPYCAASHAIFKELLRRRGNDFIFVYKHLPLTQIHPQALPAARAAWAAGRQGQFWSYHDALYENHARLGEPLYNEIASDLRLNLGHFDRDRKSPASLKAIQNDIAQADRLGLSGTPTLIMNQQYVSGPFTLEILEKHLDQQTFSK